MVRLNTLLLSALPSVLCMTHNEVSSAAGISIACWYKIVKEPERISVQQLLGLANGLSVPVRRFFSPDGADIVGTREDYILRSGYLTCYYDTDAVRRRTDRESAKAWHDAAGSVGIRWNGMAASLLTVSRTPVVKLLTFCKVLGLDVFEFIVDPNRTDTAGEDAGLHRELGELRNDIRELSESVRSLKEKFDTLLLAQRELERRMDAGLLAADP